MNGGRACHAFEASRCDAINFAANWPLPSTFPSPPSCCYALSLFSTARGINSWSPFPEREGLEQTRGSRANNARSNLRFSYYPLLLPPPSTTFRQVFRGSRISRCCNKIACFDNPRPLALALHRLIFRDKFSNPIFLREWNRCRIKDISSPFPFFILYCIKFSYGR